MLSYRLGLVVVVACLISLISTASFADEHCAEIITTKCEKCHYKTRICQKLGQKSRSSWKRTVRNMVGYGARLDQDEQKYLIRCLSGPDPSVVDVCNK